MSKNKINPKFGLIALMILLAALSRLLPHPPNFTPIGGMALFGAAYFSRKYLAFLIPFVALFFSDLILNNVVYNTGSFVWFSGISFWTYSAFAMIIGMGILMLKKVETPRLIGGSLIASGIFFLVTNYGVWASGLMPYPANGTGILACYTAGLPYFLNTILGDLFYTGVLFGSYHLVQQTSLLNRQTV